MHNEAATEPILTIAIASMQQRIGLLDLEALAQDCRWRYLIVCQDGEATRGAAAEEWVAQARAARSDVSIVWLPGRGVAASRNAAIELCRTELLLFSDDDVRILPSGLDDLVAAFEREPNLDIVCGRTTFDKGGEPKRYPPRPERLTLFNSAHVGTVELAVRTKHLLAKGLRFDTNFGAGTENHLGDEFIFLADCLRAGLLGAYRPIVLAAHPATSSGTTFDRHSAPARARAFERVFSPLFSPAIKVAFLWRHRRRFTSMRAFLDFAAAFLPWQSTRLWK